MTSNSQLKTTFTALVTPFKNQNIDWGSLERLVQFQIKNGVNAFVVNGTTAESPTLTVQEVKEIFQFMRQKFPEALLVVGTGSNSTQKTVEASLAAESIGADACLVVVPYYNKPPQRGLFAHFKTVASALTKTPVILYNVPGRTITALTVTTIKSLSEVKGIIGIKEASAAMPMAREIAVSCGSEFILLSGDDGTYVDFLNQGGHGVISVATHILPSQFVEMKKMMADGNQDGARALLEKYRSLIDLLFCEANPIPVKKALQLMGIIDSAECRLPLVELSEDWTLKLRDELKKVGLL